MSENTLKCSAKKSAKRIKFINAIFSGLDDKKTFSMIGSGKNESSVADHVSHTLSNALEKYYREVFPHQSERSILRKTEDSLLWEGNKNTTVNNISFMGTQSRPDFVAQFDGLRIAIELKRGENAQKVRDLLGQCLVYSTQFEFSCALFVDTSTDKKVKRAFCEPGNTLEKQLLDSLWQNYNIKIVIV
jgi:hypothetical protein